MQLALGPQTHPARAFRCELISSRDALRALAPDWNNLLEASPAPTIFLTWEWIQAWLDTLGQSARIRVLAVRDETGRLAALGPFYQTTFALLGVLKYRCLRVLGDARSGSEYANIIARTDVARRATHAVLDFLARNGRLWDAIWLPNMGPTAAPAEALVHTAEDLGLLCRTREALFSRINLHGSFDAYLARLSRTLRKPIRKGLDRFRRVHGALLVTADEHDYDAALCDLFALHITRWRQRGQPGAFSRPALRDFCRALARRMAGRGWLRVDRAFVDGRPVAAQMGFAYCGVFYAMQAGFDPGFPRIPGGAGTALRSLVMERLCAAGIETYDFLGGFTRSKHEAGAQPVRGRAVLIIRPAPANRLLFRSQTWPTGRYLRFVNTATPSE